MKNTPIIFLIALSLPASGALSWTGAGDGLSLYSEANFLDDNGVVPAANTVNPNTAITAATGGEIQISSGTGSPSGFGGNFVLGANNLSITNGKILQSTGTSGLNANAGGQTLSLLGGASVNVQFIVNLTTTLDGASNLTFRGGGNPVNLSTIDIIDSVSTLRFTTETYTAFDAEHSTKVTANGAALIFGTDPLVQEPGDNAIASAFNGANGVQIQIISPVPEPGTPALVLLSGLGLLLRRRK